MIDDLLAKAPAGLPEGKDGRGEAKPLLRNEIEEVDPDRSGPGIRRTHEGPHAPPIKHETLPTASAALLNYVISELGHDEPEPLGGNTGLPAAVECPKHNLIVAVTPITAAGLFDPALLRCAATCLRDVALVRHGFHPETLDPVRVDVVLHLPSLPFLLTGLSFFRGHDRSLCFVPDGSGQSVKIGRDGAEIAGRHGTARGIAPPDWRVRPRRSCSPAAAGTGVEMRSRGSGPDAGMKQGGKMMTMTYDEFETACTKAIARLLLGNHKLKPGVVLTGGGRLDLNGKIRLGQHARASETDVLHLEYGPGEDGRHTLAGMVVFMVRGGICHIQSDCRLFLPKAASRAVVLPQPDARGYFRLAPDEILHIDGKPAGRVTDGIARADVWLAHQLTVEGDAVDDG